MKIYADNAATTAVSQKAMDAMMPLFLNEYGNPSSLHSYGQAAAELLYDAREKVAAAIKATPDEIYFTSGGSEADNQAIISAAEEGERRGKKHIISAMFEHHAVLRTLDELKKRGFEVTLLDVHENGIVDPKQVAETIRPDTALVTIMFANNEIGTIQPIAEIGEICRKKSVLFHTDAVQAAGHVEIDVNKMKIDLLSISAHKFHGPKGVGALYARKGVILRSLIKGGAQERGKRAGTENVPAIVGMAVALTEAVENMSANAKKLISMRERLIEGLEKIPHCVLNGDRKQRLPGHVSFCFEGIEGESLLLYLDSEGIEASSGSACTSGSLEPSHVLLAIGRPHELAHGSLRLTLSEYNTDEDVEKIIAAVHNVVSRLRDMSPVWDELEKGVVAHVV